MSSMMTWWVSRGWPRQFPVMNEKSRCSILFHLEVPGGRWRMIKVRPISSASFCSSVFHNRLRLLSLPPFAPGILEVADQFLLLTIDRDRRLACRQRCRHAVVDVVELGIPIRMV